MREIRGRDLEKGIIMSIIGYYYLHVNGDLIYKREHDGIVEGIRESEFARAMWGLNPEDRENAWTILVEALSIGANKDRILELAQKWGCDDEDAKEYAERAGIHLGVQGNAKTASRKDSILKPMGMRISYLEAMADLCRQLGFKGGKLGWHATFKNLLEKKLDEN